MNLYVTYFTDGCRLGMLVDEGEPGYSELTPGSLGYVRWILTDEAEP